MDWKTYWLVFSAAGSGFNIQVSTVSNKWEIFLLNLSMHAAAYLNIWTSASHVKDVYSLPDWYKFKFHTSFVRGKLGPCGAFYGDS